LSYRLEFAETALSKLEDLGQSDAKRLRQIFMKMLSLRRTPFPNDSKQLVNFDYKGRSGYRVDQGEYRIIYTVDDDAKTVLIGLILNRNEDYTELKNLK
jgi:mRNA interferase RelE/StbE